MRAGGERETVSSDGGTDVTHFVTETHSWRTKWRRMWQKKLGPQISNSDLEGLEVVRGGCFVTVASTRTSAPSKCGSYVLGLYLDDTCSTSNTRKECSPPWSLPVGFKRRRIRLSSQRPSFLPFTHLFLLPQLQFLQYFWHCCNAAALCSFQLPLLKKIKLNCHC